MLLILVDAVVLVILLKIIHREASFLGAFLIACVIGGTGFGLALKFGSEWGALTTLCVIAALALAVVKLAYELPFSRAAMVVGPFLLYRVFAEFLILGSIA